MAEWFNAGALQAIPMAPTQQQVENDQGAIGQHVAASMLKMSYAAYSKGASALLLSVNALAEAGGVTEALHAEWALSAPHLLKQSQRAAQMTSGKAWRFEGEMLEISETYSNAGLPDALHAGAAEVYERMAALKDLPPQELEAVVAALLGPPENNGLLCQLAAAGMQCALDMDVVVKRAGFNSALVQHDPRNRSVVRSVEGKGRSTRCMGQNMPNHPAVNHGHHFWLAWA